MKRPLLPVALCYGGGLLLADAIQPPLLYLFVVTFLLLVLAVAWSRARIFLLWPLLVLVGWTNLVSHTMVLSPNDLRTIIGNEANLAKVRGTLVETPTRRAAIIACLGTAPGHQPRSPGGLAIRVRDHHGCHQRRSAG